MLKALQSENENKIVWIKVGAFYITTGKDAIYLNKEIGLKCTCFKNQICKVEVPINKIEDHIHMLLEIKYKKDVSILKIIKHYKTNVSKEVTYSIWQKSLRFFETLN